jgi:uncharacterized surface protein with fasciclin (FAS1) repeats
MRSVKSFWFLLGLFTVVTIASCKKWDDHIAITEQNLNENLMQHISNVSNLSKFKEYLVKTGLDKEISSSKNYTVWAPTDDALQTLSADIVNDTAKLKAYLLNHISGQLFFTRNATDSLRVPLLNGKRAFFINNKFEDANVTTADVYVRNGVLHVIDKVIAPMPSVWEYVVSTKDTYAQNSYVASLVYNAQDPTKAVLDSINPTTGQAVYKPNTGIVQINTFRTKVYDVANEDSLYTYVLLTNTAFTNEINKQKPYFQSPDATITTSNASWNVVKDFAIKGLYTPEKLPAALLSKFNVSVGMSKAAIVETRRVSNGIVYVMSDAPTAKEQKIPTVIIQGESPESFSSTDTKYISKIFYRNRFNPTTGLAFKDIYANFGSSGANYKINYITNDLYTVKYKVYWVALNDKTASGQGDDAYGTDSTLQQILTIGDDSAAVYTPTFNVQTAVKPNQYTEVYLGDYTSTSYNFRLQMPARLPDGTTFTYNPATKRIRLQAPATITTGIPYNLTLDYIKFVPVL